MGREIERKFLVLDNAWREYVTRRTEIIQGYIAQDADCTVRVRIAGPAAWLTVKGKPTHLTRAEYEYPVPVCDASRMLEDFAAGKLIRKTRNFLLVDGAEWVVDEFHDANQGLIMAEIELPDEEAPVSVPSWLGQEVSTDQRFSNAYLARHPYSERLRNRPQ